MAKTIARYVRLKVNGVDLSNHVQDIKFMTKWANVDVTGMGDAYSERLLGIGDVQCQVTFFQDFASSQVHATLQPLAGSNSSFEVEVTPDSTQAISSTNPRATMFAVLDEYDFVSAKVGDASTMQVTFFNAQPQGVSYLTT